MSENSHSEIVCSGCGNSSSDVPKVRFPSLMICKQCISDADKALADSNDVEDGHGEDGHEVDVLKDRGMSLIQKEVSKLKSPKEIFEQMGEVVIGQESARMMMATAINQHHKRLILTKHGLGEYVKKSNMLMIGSTGSGKTLLAETVSKICNMVLHIEDVTPLTAAGYIGDSVDDIISSLLSKCDDDVSKAEGSIVFLDEIDKLAKRGDSAQLNGDPSGEGVQNALLKLVEGSEVRVDASGGRKQTGAKKITVDTSKILFIASGAFSGIEDIIKNEKRGGGKIGFLRDQTVDASSECKEDGLGIMHHVTTDELIKYGMKPEFIGRFATVVPFDDVTLEIMKRIITEPKGSYFQSAQLLALADGIDLSITEEAIEVIASFAIKQKIGARAIDGALNAILKDFFFDPPSVEAYEITATMARDALKLEEAEAEEK